MKYRWRRLVLLSNSQLKGETDQQLKIFWEFHYFHIIMLYLKERKNCAKVEELVNLQYISDLLTNCIQPIFNYRTKNRE